MVHWPYSLLHIRTVNPCIFMAMSSQSQKCNVISTPNPNPHMEKHLDCPETTPGFDTIKSVPLTCDPCLGELNNPFQRRFQTRETLTRDLVS